MPVFSGTPNPDPLSGSASDDEIYGMAGDDTIYGLQGNDTVFGGDDHDSLDGGAGNDTVFGGQGNDTLIGELDNDRLYGGGDDDRLQLNSVVYGGGSRGWGGDGDDLLQAFDTSDVWANGGDGTDTLGLYWLNSTPGAGANVDISAANPFAISSLGNRVHMTSIEQLLFYGGVGDDTVIGGGLQDRIDVGYGLNRVDAGDGDDHVLYQNGQANTLTGGLGDDTLTVLGGSSQLYFIRSDSVFSNIDDGSLSAIFGFEHYDVYGGTLGDIAGLGAGADRAEGREGADTLFGNEGSDTLYGGLGDDSLDGGRDNDTVDGGAGIDRLRGSAGDDKVYGRSGADTLFGGAGDDNLVGGKASDTMTGGLGADRFIFVHNEDGFDLITDFETGVDSIRYFAANLPGGPGPGSVDPSIFSIGTLNGTAPQFVLRYHADVDETWLHWDNDGPPAGDYSLMRFSGDITVVAADIVLF